MNTLQSHRNGWDSMVTLLAVDLAETRLRCRAAELRLADIGGALQAFNTTLWSTDRELNITGAHPATPGAELAAFIMGTADAPDLLPVDAHAPACPCLGLPLADMLRRLCGFPPHVCEPLEAHRSALRGRSSTLAIHHAGRSYAMLVEPRRDQHRAIVGTVGMLIRLGDEARHEASRM